MSRRARLPEVLAVMDRLAPEAEGGLAPEQLAGQVREVYANQGLAVDEARLARAIQPTPEHPPTLTPSPAKVSRRAPVKWRMIPMGELFLILCMVGSSGVAFTILFSPEYPATPVRQVTAAEVVPSLGGCRARVAELIAQHPDAFLTVNGQGHRPAVLTPGSDDLQSNHTIAPALCKADRNTVTFQP